MDLSKKFLLEVDEFRELWGNRGGSNLRRTWSNVAKLRILLLQILIYSCVSPNFEASRASGRASRGRNGTNSKGFFRVMLATLQQRWTTFVTSTYFNYDIAMQYSNKNRICTWLQVIWPHFNSENWLLKWPARSITSKNNTSKMHKLMKQMVNASNILVLRSESITFGIT